MNISRKKIFEGKKILTHFYGEAPWFEGKKHFKFILGSYRKLFCKNLKVQGERPNWCHLPASCQCTRIQHKIQGQISSIFEISTIDKSDRARIEKLFQFIIILIVHTPIEIPKKMWEGGGQGYIKKPSPPPSRGGGRILSIGKNFGVDHTRFFPRNVFPLQKICFCQHRISHVISLYQFPNRN